MQFHILSFEGPDLYARAGGLATRVEGLAEVLAGLGFETHLWFVGDPALPGVEQRGNLYLHRWCQWVSRYHPDGVYAGEAEKVGDYSASLPPFLFREVMEPHLRAGGRAVVLAEEWQTVESVLKLHALLEGAGLRRQGTLLWNANNVFGFERIPWAGLARAATITTVSRYMKHCMQEWGVQALVIPNGLPPDAFDVPERGVVAAMRQRLRDRTVLSKMARFDPDKRWIESIEIVAELKRQGWRPLLVARGGLESHGEEVRRAAERRGLRMALRHSAAPGGAGLLGALSGLGQVDIVELCSHVDPGARRVLFRSADAVLANSRHEPFGLVGLETMAAGGVACTGCSGEDYALPGQNALVLETGDPREFLGLFRRLLETPGESRSLRRAGQSTARRYAWCEVVQRVLLPRVELPSAGHAGVLEARLAS